MTKSRAEKLIIKWLDRLDIREHTVTFSVDRPDTSGNEEIVKGSEHARVLTLTKDHSSHISFNAFTFRNITEETIVHELVHILFDKIDSFVKSLNIDTHKHNVYDGLEEILVEHLTRCLYRKKGK